MYRALVKTLNAFYSEKKWVFLLHHSLSRQTSEVITNALLSLIAHLATKHLLPASAELMDLNSAQNPEFNPCKMNSEPYLRRTVKSVFCQRLQISEVWLRDGTLWPDPELRLSSLWMVQNGRSSRTQAWPHQHHIRHASDFLILPFWIHSLHTSFILHSALHALFSPHSTFLVPSTRRRKQNHSRCDESRLPA